MLCSHQRNFRYRFLQVLQIELSMTPCRRGTTEHREKCKVMGYVTYIGYRDVKLSRKMDSPAGFGICVYEMRLGGEMPGCGCQWKCYHCRPGIGENSCWFSVTNNSLGVAAVKVLRFQQAWSGWRSCCFCPLGFFEKRKTMSTQTRVTIVDYYRLL